jgi:nucleoside-diphosphate-sugar epimerase
MKQLADRFELIPMSRSIDGTDLIDPGQLIDRFADLDAVVHLAWQYAGSDAPQSLDYFDNLRMNLNVLEAAATVGVGRVLLASSVHADYFYDWTGPALKHPHDEPRGNGPYGCAKVMVEELACRFTNDAMRVACIRYGAVTADNQPHPTDDWERRVWLSHADAGSLIDAALTRDWPEPYTLCYGVSNNEGRVHDLSNPWGWSPAERAERLA